MQFRFNNQSFIFKPKLIPSVATVICLSILLTLCGWQIKRLFWKTELIETRIQRFESEPKKLSNIKNPTEHEFKKVFVNGELINDIEFFMPALSKRGNNGFHILTPLRASNGKIYIYDSGWVPTFKKDKETRKENLVFGENLLEAVIRTPGRKGKFQPENDEIGNYWFFVEPLKMERIAKMQFEKAIYLEAVNDGPNGFPLGGQTRIYIRNNHLQYAITWFLISCGLIGVFLAASIKKKLKL